MCQSTLFQSCPDGTTASCVLPVLFFLFFLGGGGGGGGGGGVNVSFSRIQNGDLSENRTLDLSLRSPTL